MTSETLRRFIDARPFQPFMISLAGGGEVTVTHPELIAYGGRRTVAVVDREADAGMYIDLPLADAIRAAPAAASPRPTGRRSH